MSRRIIRLYSENRVAFLFIKATRLEVERIDVGVEAASTPGFSFRSSQQSSPNALCPVTFGDPEQPGIEPFPAGPDLPDKTTDDGGFGVAGSNGEEAEVGRPNVLDVEGHEARVHGLPDVFRRVGLDTD